MIVIPDSELQKLAAPQVDRLLPVLDRAAGMWPLIVVLGFVPPLLALTGWTLTDSDANWGLRAIAAATAGDVGQGLDPVHESTRGALRWQPPLQTWLSAAGLRFSGFQTPLALLIPSWLAMGLTVWAVFRIVERLSDARRGLLTAGLMALHYPILVESRSAAPAALTICAGAWTLLGFIEHVRTAEGVASLRLLAAGVALALTGLAGGLFAAIVILSLPVVVFSMQGPRSSDSCDPPELWTAVGAISVLIMTAFAVGSWWFLMMAPQGGMALLSSALEAGVTQPILAGSPQPAASRGLDQLWHLMNGLSVMVMGLSGLVLISVWRLIRGAVAADEQAETDWYGRLLGMAGPLVLILWVAVRVWLPVDCLLASQVQQLLALVVVGYAAWGLAEVCERRVRFLWLTTATILSLLVLPLPSSGAGGSLMSHSVSPWLTAVVTISLIAMVWWLRRPTHQEDERQRALLIALLAIQIVTSQVVSVRALRSRSDSLLATLGEQRPAPPAQLGVLISEQEPTPRLIFCMQLLVPDNPVMQIRHPEELLQAIDGIPIAIVGRESTTGEGLSIRDLSVEVRRSNHILVGVWGEFPVSWNRLKQTGWESDAAGQVITIHQQPWQIRGISRVEPMSASLETIEKQPE